MIDERFTTPWPHRCALPYTAEVKHHMLNGVRFICDPETKQERRHRLGLKWWQREPW